MVNDNHREKEKKTLTKVNLEVCDEQHRTREGLAGEVLTCAAHP
jgi:hypothetical protein